MKIFKNLYPQITTYENVYSSYLFPGLTITPEYLSKYISDIGKMLGGWMKSKV